VCEVGHDAGLKAFLWCSLRRQPGYLFCREDEEGSSVAVTVSSEREQGKGKGRIKTEEKQVCGCEEQGVWTVGLFCR
jgi:hypothetical protein